MGHFNESKSLFMKIIISLSRKIWLIILFFSNSIMITANAQPKKVIIDCDPGDDDALELILAMQSPEIEIVGITTVSGNAYLDQCTKNALRVVELSGKNIPVYKGAEKSLVVPQETPPDFIHGKDGLGNTNQPEPKISVQSKPAAQFIVDITKAYPGEIIILAVGKLTNLAEAIRLDSNVTRNVKEVVVVAGALSVPGIVTPVAEPNIWADPHAADIVFAAPWNVTMFSLDVTLKCVLPDELLLHIKKSNSKYGEFIYAITRLAREFQMKTIHTDGYLEPGSVAILYMIDSSIFKFKQVPVRVVTDGIAIAQTIMPAYEFQLQQPLFKDRPLIKVALEIDVKRFLKYYEAILLRSQQ